MTKAKEKKHEGEVASLIHKVEAVAADYVPEGYEDVETYLTEMREDYDDDVSADYDNRLEAIDDKKFTAGEQWDPQVRSYREGLPCLTINQIPQFTAQLVGDWRQARNSVRVLPAEDGDAETAEIRGDLIRSIIYKSRANRVFDNAFESTVQCGDGAFRVGVEYARDDVFDQDIVLRPIEDALSVVWDRMSVDPTGRDARHCFVEDVMPLREFNRHFPDASPSELGDSTSRNLRSTGWLDQDVARVVEHWRIIERDRLLGLFEDGSIHYLDTEALETLPEIHGPVVKTRLAPCKYAQMHLVTGWKLLSGPYEWKLNRLPIIRMTGRVVTVEGKRFRYGLVRFMKDPSRLRNFWRSIAAESLGYAPKAQWMATESAVEGKEDSIRNGHLSRDPLLIFNDEAVFGQNVQRMEPPVPQMAVLNEASINTQDMKDVTGIHDASLGIKSNETSGKAIRARQVEGDVASLTYHDNGNASVLEAGDVINQLIGQIYDGTRILRLIGQDETPKLMKVNDPYDPKSPNLATGMYDVALDTGPSYTTKRQEAAESMMSAVQVWPQLIQIAGDLVAKAQDWPGAHELSERLKRTIPPQFLDEEERQEMEQEGGSQFIDPAQMQELAGQAQQMQQELQKMQMKLDDKDRELDIKEYDAVTQRIRALSDNMVDGNDIELRAISETLAHAREVDKQIYDSDTEEARPSPQTSAQ